MRQVHHLPPEKAQRTLEAARLPFRVQLVQTLGSAKWATKIGTGLVDPGKPLGNAVKVTTNGAGRTKSNTIGMSILQQNPWMKPWRWSKTIIICTGQKTARGVSAPRFEARHVEVV